MIRSPKNLTEVCHWFECDGHENEKHLCGHCAEGENIMTERIGPDDIVRFQNGREITGRDLMKNAAGKTLVELAKQEAKRTGCTVYEALRHNVKITTGEIKSYLTYFNITDSTRLLPRGIKTATAIEFHADQGWTQAGVEEWIEEQGFVGGTLATVARGWKYTPDMGENAFPR